VWARVLRALSFGVFAANGLGCEPLPPEVHTLVISAHELPGCRDPESGPFTLTLNALGHFRAGPFDVETLPLRSPGRSLGFSEETTGVQAIATHDATRLIGYAEHRAGADAIDVLLWPEGSACTLHVASETTEYPGNAAGQALGFSAAAGLALVAGENAADRRAGSALRFETSTGISGVQPRERSLRRPRAFATLTPFADGFLLAGGEEPANEATGQAAQALANAEVYSSEAAAFTSTIPLVFSRTHHAALVLRATGETLLIGGASAGGLVQQLEAVSPRSGASATSGLAKLETPRLDPIALELENGELLVGGGRFDDGDPVGSLEWFSADASSALDRRMLPARPHRTFVAMPGGGVLSVGGCDPDTSDPCDSVDAWWITPEHAIEPVDIDRRGRDCPLPARPQLTTGSDGSPYLVAVGDENDRDCAFALYRFNPWPRDYSAEAEACLTDPAAPACAVLDVGPRFELTDIQLTPRPDPRVPLLSLAPDNFLWVSADSPGSLAGIRLGERGALTRDALPLVALTDPLNRLRPLHLVPDRNTLTPLLRGEAPAAYFERSLTLLPAVPNVSIWVSDTRYEDVSVTLDLTPESEQQPTPPPLILLGNTVLGADAGCVWPDLPSAPPSPLRAQLRRLGTEVELTFAGITRRCSVPAGALPLGFRAGSTATRVRSIAITRE
jgi:hypothetical protein